MIKNFKQYNEGLTDKMTPKSEDEIIKSLDEEIERIKTIPGYKADINKIIDMVIQIKEMSEIFKDLITSGIDGVELLYLMLDDNNFMPHKNYFKRTKNDILVELINYIKDNKENLKYYE
jgi:hypothetical protein